MTDALKILLVEDDLDTRANLCDILALDGHEITVAGSAAEARALATSLGASVVILDRRLPDETAEQFLPKLRQLLPHAEIIVVTGFADMDSTIAALRHGAADYILKPIHPDALRNSLDRIVQRRQVEQALKQEQQFANRILETAEAVVLILDLQGKIVRFNPYFERITGWALDEIQGECWFDRCIPPEDHEWLHDVFMQTAASVESSGVVNPVLTKDGNRRQMRWSNTTLADESGTATSVLAVGVDVTDLLEAQESALRSQRLAAIGQTMAALAHESRNALQRIQAAVEMLSLEMDQHSESRKDLGAIQRAAQDLNELLEEVRAFAGPIHLQMEQVNLADVWRRAWDHLAAMRESREIELVESLDAGDLSVSIDSLRMELVFRNLFENAMAACDDPTRISITCESTDDDCVRIRVCDNGPGLTAEQREKLFDPFFTTKSTGTGLGLSIVQRIIHAHGGEIQVQPPHAFDEPVGAGFLIRIPRSAPSRGAARE